MKEVDVNRADLAGKFQRIATNFMNINLSCLTKHIFHKLNWLQIEFRVSYDSFNQILAFWVFIIPNNFLFKTINELLLGFRLSKCYQVGMRPDGKNSNC